MKILLPVLFIMGCVLSAFGQTAKPTLRPIIKKPARVRVSRPIPPKAVKPAPEVVIVQKTNGEKITGVFLSAEVDSILIKSGEIIKIPVAEIASLTFDHDAVDRAVFPAPAPKMSMSMQVFNVASSKDDEAVPTIGTDPRSKSALAGGVLNGKATELPKPAYPPAARAVHAMGTVSVQVLIDENGNVVFAIAVTGHPLLRTAAVQAAQQAKFSPTTLEGKPVKVSGIITYNFVP